jgi:hypothetical protein
VVRATEAAGTVVRAVVVHRDADGPDPAAGVESELAAQLAPIPGRPAVPMQAIEASRTVVDVTRDSAFSVFPSSAAHFALSLRTLWRDMPAPIRRSEYSSG